MVHNLLKKLVENATNDEKERLLNSASYFDLRGMLSLTNLAQEASSLAAVHINSLLYILLLNQQGINHDMKRKYLTCIH